MGVGRRLSVARARVAKLSDECACLRFAMRKEVISTANYCNNLVEQPSAPPCYQATSQEAYMPYQLLGSRV
jgi:hypothetical protein